MNRDHCSESGGLGIGTGDYVSFGPPVAEWGGSFGEQFGQFELISSTGRFRRCSVILVGLRASIVASFLAGHASGASQSGSVWVRLAISLAAEARNFPGNFVGGGRRSVR